MSANDIGHRQNAEENVERLAAQRTFYSRAKAIRGANVFVATALAFAAPVVALLWPSASPGLALGGLLWSILELVLLDGREEHNRQLGALTQEEFDTVVLGLPWNDSLGARPATEQVIEAGKKGRESATLKDWYPDVASLPPGLAALVCQRSCISWDRRSRGTYQVLLLIVALGLGIGAAAFAVWRELKLAEFLVTLAVPMWPAFQHAVKTFKAHRRASVDEERLHEDWSSGWEDALASGGAVRAEKIRRVQDRLFQLRREQPPVPDALYWLMRPSNEGTMVDAAKRLVSAASEKLNESR